MFTLIFLYIFWYFLTMLFVYFYLFLFKFGDITTKLSFSKFWGLLTNYHDISWIFKFFILQLSGLPPFFFFFLKFLLLEQFMTKASYTLIILTIINFLLGMFFYIKIYFTTDYSSSDFGLKELSNRGILENNNYFYLSRVYYFVFFSIIIVLVSCLSFIFLVDFMLYFNYYLKLL